MKVLGLDIETGSHFKEVKEKTIVTEIGLVLWETETKTPLEMINMIVNEGVDVDPEATAYTGITQNTVIEHGIKPSTAISIMCSIIEKAERIVAHNGNEFDRPILTHFATRYGFNLPSTWEKNWIDTQSDIDYPSHMRSRNLIYLAACHGFVNPFSHRAVTDVLSMLRVMSNYDVNQLVANADSPKKRVIALVSFDDRQLAKDAGFYFDGEKKVWFRQMRQNQVESFIKDLPFKTVVKDLT